MLSEETRKARLEKSNKVEKKGIFYYFKGIQLRGRLLTMRKRVVGVRKAGRLNEWVLSCTTKSCQGTCTYMSGHDSKNVQYALCDKCRFPMLGTTLKAQIDGQMHERVVSHGVWDGYYGKPKYYVDCQDCNARYALKWFTGRMRRLHCFACHKKHRTRFGYYVASDHVWSYRAILRPPKVYQFERQIHIDWQIDCPTKGCPNAVGLRKGRQMVCATCRIDARAMPDYHALYNAHIRQDQQRRERNPKHKLSELTLEQFVKLMADDTCHYCKEPVLRHPRTKHTGTDGKRMSASVFVDRLDSSEPYRVGNVVTCCTGCNITKNAYLTEDEMMLIASLRRGAKKEARAIFSKLCCGYRYPKPRDKLLKINGGFRPREPEASP